MKKIFIIAALFAASLITEKTFGQDFTYFRVTESGDYASNLTFKNIPSKEKADEILSQVYQIDGVLDFELLYPESFKARITMSKLIDVEDLIARMKSINIELTNESLNFDTK